MSLHGDPGEPCCDLAPSREVPAAPLSPFASPYLSTTLRRVSLPSTGPSRSSPGLLWGTEGSRVVGAPQMGGSARGHPGDWGRGTPGHAVLAPSSHLHCALRPGRGQSSLSPPCHRRRTVPSSPAFLGCHPTSACISHCPTPAAPGRGGLCLLRLPDNLRSLLAPWECSGPGVRLGVPAPLPFWFHAPPSTRCSGCPQRPAGPARATASRPRLPRTTGTTAPVKH